jgi:TetR/AcrR family transcriptional repressor of nem operon
MGRPRHSEATRRKLLEQGVSAFLEHGFHGTGIKEVLDRVKVPKGSFYNYFQTKEDFGAEAIRFYAASLGEKLAAALDGAPDPVSGLRAFFSGLMREFEAADYVGGCLVANLGGEVEGSQTCRTALGDAFLAWREGVRAALADGQRLNLVRSDIDAGELADLLTECWEGAVIRMKIDRSVRSLQRCVDRLLGDYFRP